MADAGGGAGAGGGTGGAVAAIVGVATVIGRSDPSGSSLDRPANRANPGAKSNAKRSIP